MYVQQLSEKNYRCFSEFSTVFTPGLNVVAGGNGAGKTSVLKAVACALATVAGQYANVEWLTVDDVRRQVEKHGTRVRFEPCLPSVCSIHWQAGEQQIELSQERNSLLSDPSWFSRWGTVTIDDVFPLLTFYKADRQWFTPRMLSETNAVSGQDSRRDGYQYWFNATTSQQAINQ